MARRKKQEYNPSQETLFPSANDRHAPEPPKKATPEVKAAWLEFLSDILKPIDFRTILKVIQRSKASQR